jgi:hypothetical protein
MAFATIFTLFAFVACAVAAWKRPKLIQYYNVSTRWNTKQAKWTIILLIFLVWLLLLISMCVDSFSVGTQTSVYDITYNDSSFTITVTAEAEFRFFDMSIITKTNNVFDQADKLTYKQNCEQGQQNNKQTTDDTENIYTTNNKQQTTTNDQTKMYICSILY